jgi:serine/threonine protein kinase
MSPEQASGDYLSPAADVWGIGAVLFEAATGEVPFEAYDDEMRYEQLERRAESVRLYRRVSAAFNDLVGSCLKPKPTRRPTVGELADALNELVQKLQPRPLRLPTQEAAHRGPWGDSRI